MTVLKTREYEVSTITDSKQSNTVDDELKTLI